MADVRTCIAAHSRSEGSEVGTDNTDKERRYDMHRRLSKRNHLTVSDVTSDVTSVAPRVIQIADAAGARTCVVLSPHLDDALFSVWHILVSWRDVRVVTVFAGVPDPGFVTALDRAHGAADSADWMRKRLDDDRAALALADREPTHVSLLDLQYRAYQNRALRKAIEHDPTRFVALIAEVSNFRVSPAELRHELMGFVEGATLVYAPTGIGGHPDHRDVARFGLQLAEEGREVRLYADIPYVLGHGLPSWLGKTENRRADAQVEDALAALSAPHRSFARHIVRLTSSQVEAKMAAARRYETEFEWVDAGFGGVLTDSEMMRYELFWTIHPEATGSA